jgi:hypothetical protein
MNELKPGEFYVVTEGQFKGQLGRAQENRQAGISFDKCHK